MFIYVKGQEIQLVDIQNQVDFKVIQIQPQITQTAQEHKMHHVSLRVRATTILV